MKAFLKHAFVWMVFITFLTLIVEYFKLSLNAALNIGAVYGFAHHIFYDVITGPWRKK